MLQIVDHLRKAVEKIGFIREKYVEDNIPTNINKIVVVLFFGDMRSEYIMSSFILNRIKEKYPDKYFIICSHTGRSQIYQYADEFWGYSSKELFNSSFGFGNNSAIKDRIEKEMIKYFDNIIVNTDYYKNGFTKKFFDDFNDIKYTLPNITSGNCKGDVFLYPCRQAICWGRGEEEKVDIKYRFWHELLEEYCKSGMKPLVYQDDGCYDMSKAMESKCNYCIDGKILSAMRSCKCVIDVFSGVSALSKIARVPYLSCDERIRYNNTKEWELDALVSFKRKHIFTFPTILDGDHFGMKNIVRNTELFISSLNSDDYYSSKEQTCKISYELVKEKKRKKIGKRLFKSE